MTEMKSLGFSDVELRPEIRRVSNETDFLVDLLPVIEFTVCICTTGGIIAVIASEIDHFSTKCRFQACPCLVCVSRSEQRHMCTTSAARGP
jgi:hypothetical protein